MQVRFIIPGAVALGILALGTSTLAQNVPAQFVVSGKAAEQIHDFTTINLATAERIAETCERLAAAEGVAISVMVLDNDGNHVYMDRMDGQGYLNIVTADMKARTALLGREPLGKYGNMCERANDGGNPCRVDQRQRQHLRKDRSVVRMANVAERT